MALVSITTRTWLHSLTAAAIAALSTSVLTAVADPTAFAFTKANLTHIALVSGLSAVMAVLALLKQSPLPPTPTDPATPPTPPNTAATTTLKSIAFFMFALGLGLMSLGGVMLLTGCSGLPQWISDGEQIVPELLLSAGAILAFIGKLTGQGVDATVQSELTSIGTEIEQGLTVLDETVTAYKSGTSTLADVEAAAQVVINSAGGLLADFGLPATVTAPYVALAQLIITQLEAWTSTLPVATAPAGAKVALTIPMTAKEYKAAHQKVVEVTTKPAA